jgi:hypothetical protein
MDIIDRGPKLPKPSFLSLRTSRPFLALALFTIFGSLDLYIFGNAMILDRDWRDLQTATVRIAPVWIFFARSHIFETSDYIRGYPGARFLAIFPKTADNCGQQSPLVQPDYRMIFRIVANRHLYKFARCALRRVCDSLALASPQIEHGNPQIIVGSTDE